MTLLLIIIAETLTLKCFVYQGNYVHCNDGNDVTWILIKTTGRLVLFFFSIYKYISFLFVNKSYASWSTWPWSESGSREHFIVYKCSISLKLVEVEPVDQERRIARGGLRSSDQTNKTERPYVLAPHAVPRRFTSIWMRASNWFPVSSQVKLLKNLSH